MTPSSEQQGHRYDLFTVCTGVALVLHWCCIGVALVRLTVLCRTVALGKQDRAAYDCSSVGQRHC